MLDAAVAELAEKLYNKLPECTRYTKQQLNFWRDFSWSMTIGHARDWLSVHAGAPEVIDGLKSFRKKGEMPYAKIRERAAAPLTQERSGGPATSAQGNSAAVIASAASSATGTSKFGPGVELNPCKACNAPMPTDFAFCGACGQKR
jgi:hypothetical protein